MTTVEQWIYQRLFNSGLFEREANAVIERIKAIPSLSTVHWSGNYESYPQEFLAVLWLQVELTTLEWIDNTCPQAWYRPLFAESSTTEREG